MFKTDIITRIEKTGAMAIVRTETIERGIEIAQGCLNGGVDVLEISYTLPNAGEVIEAINKKFNDQLVVGAGTVLDAETARLAILAPGCTTITEMVEAMEVGASFIKAFPISNFYGPELVSVLKTPIPVMPILASGGITLDNLSDWIKKGTECCGFGGLLTKGTSEEITENAKKIRAIIDETRSAMK